MAKIVQGVDQFKLIYINPATGEITDAKSDAEISFTAAEAGAWNSSTAPETLSTALDQIAGNALNAKIVTVRMIVSNMSLTYDRTQDGAVDFGITPEEGDLIFSSGTKRLILVGATTSSFYDVYDTPEKMVGLTIAAVHGEIKSLVLGTISYPPTAFGHLSIEYPIALGNNNLEWSSGALTLNGNLDNMVGINFADGYPSLGTLGAGRSGRIYKRYIPTSITSSTSGVLTLQGSTTELAVGMYVDVKFDTIDDGGNYVSYYDGAQRILTKAGNDITITNNGGTVPADEGSLTSSELFTIGLASTNHIHMFSKNITGLGAPTLAGDAATKGYVDTVADDYLLKAGGALTGPVTSTSSYIATTGNGGTGVMAKASAANVGNNLLVAENFAGTGYMYAGQNPDGTFWLDVAATGFVTFNNASRIEGVLDPTAAQDVATKNYVDTTVGALTGGLEYKGTFDADTPAPDLDAQDNYKGDFYKVSVAGTYLGIALEIGDMIIVNKDVLTATTITAADIDVIDNTEAADIIRDSSTPTAGDISGSFTAGFQIVADSIVNADINSSAAIAYSKLALTGAILNADLAGSIAYSKLSLSDSIVNADINSSAAIAYSKLALSDSIVNADINSAAAIAYSKLNLGNSIVLADLTADSVDQNKIAASAIGSGLTGGGGSVIAIDYTATHTFTGVVSVAAPTVDGHAATKLYVDTQVGGASGLTKYTPANGAAQVPGVMVYLSADETVSVLSDLTQSHFLLGIVSAYDSGAGKVSVLANDKILDADLSAVDKNSSPVVAGDRVYWTGSALTGDMPTATDTRVWQVGIVAKAGASGKIHTEVQLIKVNA